jgi:lipoprotein-releasing system permease protein
MNKLLPFYIGLRYSKSKKRQFFISFISFISMSGIALGVCVLITVLSVMNGFDEEIEQRVFDLAPQIVIQNDKLTYEKMDEVKRDVSKYSDVVGVAPYVNGKGLVRFEDTIKPILVNGIVPKEEKFVSALNKKLIVGNLEQLTEKEFKIIIGDKLASELNVTIGDKLTILVPHVSVNPIGAFPRYKRFTITGVFSSDGWLGYDSYSVYVHINDAKTLFNLSDNISGIRIKTKSLYLAPKVTKLLENELSDDFSIVDWTNQFGSYLKAVKLEKTMMLLILVLLIVIAAFNLIASLVMLVNEKQADIAILRTIGAKPRTILSIFIIQGSMVGLVGTGIGTILGIFLANHVSEAVEFILYFTNLKNVLSSVYLVDSLPSKILYSDLIIICCISLSLSFLATIYPAFRASKLHPALTLRYE